MRIGSIQLTKKEAADYIKENRVIFVTRTKVMRLNEDFTVTILRNDPKASLTRRGRFFAFTEEAGKIYWANA